MDLFLWIKLYDVHDDSGDTILFRHLLENLGTMSIATESKHEEWIGNETFDTLLRR